MTAPGTSEPNRADRSLTLAICAISGLFFLYLLAPVCLGLAFTTDDLLSQNLPFRKFYADCLQRHESFLWSPNLYSGFYIHGEGQAGMMHPFHLLLYSVLPLTTAFGIEIVSIYVFLFAGSYLFFRDWKLGVHAALFGSFLFTFGGTNLVLMEHMNAVAVVAHLPWILMAIHRVFDPGTVRTRALWMSAVAMLIGSQVLLGHPQSVYFCALIEAGYAVYLMTIRSAEEARWRRLLQVAAALATGLLIGSVQLLPTTTAVRDSVRAEPPMEFLSEMSLQPQELLQWINPLMWKGARYDQLRGFYNYLIYFGGTVTLLLFIWILTRKELVDARRKLTRFLGIVGFAGMFLALGKYNLLFPLYARLPIIGLFRGPARYTILTDFAVAAGAALALDHLRTLGGQLAPSALVRRLAVFFAAGSLATVLVALLAKLAGTPGTSFLSALTSHLASPVVVLAGALLVCAGAVLFLVSARVPRMACSALTIFVLLDVACIQGAILLLHNKIDDPYPDNSVPVDAPGPVQAPYGDQLLLLDYRLVNGYSGLEPGSTIPIESGVYARIMGARAVVVDDKWIVLSNPLPLLRLRNQAVPMENRAALLADSSLLAQSALMEYRYTPAGLERDLNQVIHFDFVHAALVEAPIALDSGASGSLNLIGEHPGRMSLVADVTGSILATTGTRFHAGWKVTLDGKPLNILRVDGSLLGFIVPTGHHRIECRFDPDDFRWGEIASLTGVAVALLYPGIVFIRFRSHTGTGEIKKL